MGFPASSAAVLAAALVGCGSATSPSGGGASNGAPPTHPSGVIAAVDTLAGGPSSVAVTRHGVVLAGMISSTIVRTGSLATMTFTDSVQVGDTPRSVAIDSTGATAYVATTYGQVVVAVDVASRAVTATTPLGEYALCVAVAPNGRRVYATTAPGTLFAIDAASHAVIDTLWVGTNADGLVFSPDGSRLYVSARDAGIVAAVDPSADTITRIYDVGPLPERMAISADGRTLYAADQSVSLDKVDLQSGAVTHPDSSAGGYGIGLTPDGAQLYLTLVSPAEVWIVDPATLHVQRVLPIGGWPDGVAFDSTGDLAVVMNGQSAIFVR